LKTSIAPTYDSRETGKRYSVATWVGHKFVDRHELDDPFVRHEVRIGWTTLLRGLLRRKLTVVVLVSADKELMDDVLELDANALVLGRSRRVEFDKGMHVALSESVAGDGTAGERRLWP
jgi:hypothetical protein